MSKKKTQTELLQEIADLLTPVANLARYNIGLINQQLQAAQKAKEEAEEAEE